MKAKKFNLAFLYDKYSDCVQETFKSIFKNGDLTDIILICHDNLFLKAHKIVLSSWSPVFKRIISTLPSFGATVFLRGMKGYEMETLLEIMYLGQANCDQDKIENILAVAKDFQIKGLSENVEVSAQEDENTTAEVDFIDVNEANNDCQDIEQMETKQKDTDQDYVSHETMKEEKIKVENEKVTVGFVCKDCGFRGQSQFKLNRHVQSLHSNERFKCTLCDKILSRKDKLIEHRLRLHSN